MGDIRIGNQKRLLISITLLIPFILLFSGPVRSGTAEYFRGLDYLIISMVQSLHNETFTTVVLAVTFLGGIPALTGVVALGAVVFLYYKRWITALFYAGAVALGGGLNALLKWLFQRDRPDFNPLVIEQGFSFPSGHAMGATITYGLLAYFVVIHLQEKGAKATVISVAVTLILLIGLSRIYLGVHYFTDIIAGFLAGALWIMISVFVWKRITKGSTAGV
ncbi:phosphatase PAP2 family protein [Alteribacter keqinensis]|nr:phosphatase PAP2 family protein [Alteribacter keqinensis]